MVGCIRYATWLLVSLLTVLSKGCLGSYRKRSGYDIHRGLVAGKFLRVLPRSNQHVTVLRYKLMDRGLAFYRVLNLWVTLCSYDMQSKSLISSP
jgi:hypothetical protein